MEEAAAAELVDEAVVEVGDVEEAEVVGGICVDTADWMPVTADAAMLMKLFNGFTVDD